jgi:hypothetical protein
MSERIEITPAEMAEGLRLLREMKHLHELMHVAESDYERYIGHLAAIHRVPAGYALHDWVTGFEPVKENGNG